MAEVCALLGTVRSAIAIGLEINNMIEVCKNKKGALNEVKNKITVVNNVLDLVQQNIQSVESNMMQTVLEKLSKLGDEVREVQSMNKFVYILRAKDCQESLRSSIGEVQFYLMSLQCNQNNSIYSQTVDIKRILIQGWNAVQCDAALQKKLEKEQKQARKLKDQVQANQITIKELKKFGLDTQLELEKACKRVEHEQKLLQAVQDSKKRYEAAYLAQVIQMLQANLTPEPVPEPDPEQPEQPGPKLAEQPVSKLVEEPGSERTEPFNPLCPVTFERLVDPVILDCRCKSTVSRSSIEKWLEHQTKPPVICPVCGSQLLSILLVPNKPIQEWLEANPPPEEPPKPCPVQPKPDPVPPESCCTKWKRWVRLLLLLLIMAIVGTVIGVVVSDGPDPPTDPPDPNVSDGSFCQVGLDLNGEADGDALGFSVALSSDGNRVAVGSNFNDGNGNTGSHARIFDWNGSRWAPAGSALDSGVSGDNLLGIKVALSADGNRVAVGQGGSGVAGLVRIFGWTGSEWDQVGSDLVSGELGDYFGWSVALSANGDHVAIGAPFSNAGLVRINEWSGSQWLQVGSDLVGEETGDEFGWSVAISADGNRVAIGARGSDGNGERAGHVHIVNWSSSSWVPVGSNLGGDAAGDEFGWSVALSSDGDRVAVGAIGNEEDHVIPGYVRNFNWLGNEWGPVGSDLVGATAGDFFGFSVALSSDGNRVAIGAPNDDDYTGLVFIFDWPGSEWKKYSPDDEYGEVTGESFGFSVALSADGNRVAIGAPGFENQAGRALVYNTNSSICFT